MLELLEALGLVIGQLLRSRKLMVCLISLAYCVTERKHAVSDGGSEEKWMFGRCHRVGEMVCQGCKYVDGGNPGGVCVWGDIYVRSVERLIGVPVSRWSTRVDHVHAKAEVPTQLGVRPHFDRA